MTDAPEPSAAPGETLSGALPSSLTLDLSFENLDDIDFEDFVQDLMGTHGSVNVDWRKGTPKKASPSDRGRDIVAQ